jgi:TPR repeat protein
MEKSATKNSAAGRNSLGVMYLNGYGIDKDVNKAFKVASAGSSAVVGGLCCCQQLFHQSASAGNPEGQLNLGTMFYNGLGAIVGNNCCCAWHS